jgi:glycosidase
MNKSIGFIIVFLLSCITAISQVANIERTEPPFWWTGMKNQELQLLVEMKNIQDYQVKIKKAGVFLQKVIKADNPNYVILKLQITHNAQPGNYPIQFLSNHDSIILNYELKEKTNDSSAICGINSSDLIYLLIPDRFSNGDISNDVIQGMNDSIFSRDSLLSRHGGDIKGIMNHLDYFKELGITAIWTTPVFEDNQLMASYHGYAITNHYKIDPRLGTNELYKELVNRCHKNNLKVIMDVVYNHIGDEHWMYKDIPFKNWFHFNKTYIKTNFRDVVWMDPYVSDTDKTIYTEGWFDKFMPDLNQSDSLLATYLIQNTLWWITYAGVDGLRFDTYPYPDQKFMSTLIQAIEAEYPKIGIFGETWVSGLANQAYYTKGSGLNNPYHPQLPGVTDFQLYYAIHNALTRDFGWTDGVAALYYCLANDFLYKNPYKNVIFLDNHDQNRFYSVIHEDINKFKMGVGFLLTTRGIPCLYYGTEILMKNFGPPDEKLREDFPGGWNNDQANKFVKNNLSPKEKEAFEFCSKLALYRKNNTALQTGKLKQFIPENGIYVYFRYNTEKTMMIILNQNKEKITLNTSRYNEMLRYYSGAINIISNEKISNLKEINIEPLSVTILELKK